MARNIEAQPGDVKVAGAAATAAEARLLPFPESV